MKTSIIKRDDKIVLNNSDGMLEMFYRDNSLTYNMHSLNEYNIFSITEEDKELYKAFSILFFEISNGILYRQTFSDDNYDFLSFLNMFREEYYEIYNEDNLSISILSDTEKSAMKIFFSRNEFLLVFRSIDNSNKVTVEMNLDTEGYNEFYMPFLRVLEYLMNNKNVKLVKKR